MIPAAVDGRWRLITSSAARMKRPWGVPATSRAVDRPRRRTKTPTKTPEPLAQQRERMPAEAESQAAVVFDQLLPLGRTREQRRGLGERRFGKHRPWLRYPGHRPVDAMTVPGKSR